MGVFYATQALCVLLSLVWPIIRMQLQYALLNIRGSLACFPKKTFFEPRGGKIVTAVEIRIKTSRYLPQTQRRGWRALQVLYISTGTLELLVSVSTGFSHRYPNHKSILKDKLVFINFCIENQQSYEHKSQTKDCWSLLCCQVYIPKTCFWVHLTFFFSCGNH